MRDRSAARKRASKIPREYLAALLLDPVSLWRSRKRSVNIGCWRVLPKERCKDGAEVVCLGYGED